MKTNLPKKYPVKYLFRYLEPFQSISYPLDQVNMASMQRRVFSINTGSENKHFVCRINRNKNTCEITCMEGNSAKKKRKKRPEKYSFRHLEPFQSVSFPLDQVNIASIRQQVSSSNIGYENKHFVYRINQDKKTCEITCMEGKSTKKTNTKYPFHLLQPSHGFTAPISKYFSLRQRVKHFNSIYTDRVFVMQVIKDMKMCVVIRTDGKKKT